jgi:hypothetical protein
MDHRPDYILDLSHRPDDSPAQASRAPSTRSPRRWIAVQWRCCNVYSRLYRDDSATRYTGQCPSCGRSVTAAIGPGGTDQRFFIAQ